VSSNKKDGKELKLISFVTRRLVEGQKGEFIKIVNEHFDVKIGMRNSQDTHVVIRGPEDRARAASEFLQRMDQKAELFAKERHLIRTKQVRDKEWGHMRVELNDALKKLRGHSPAKPNPDVLPDTHLSEVFEDKSRAEQVRKENTSEQRRGKTVSGFYPKNVSQAIGIQALKDSNASVHVFEGPAGCGKTQLAMSYAIDVHASSDYDEILLFRPRTVTGKEKMGAMPGDADEKMDFYTQPFAKKVKEITGKPITHFGKMKRLTPDGERGASHVKTLTIVDEAQNLSADETKMLLTRMGQGGRFIICGDISNNQRDTDEDKMSGFAHFIAHQAAKFNRGDEKLRKGMALIAFTEQETEARHHMMPSLIGAYNNPEPELKALMDKVTSFRRNAQAIQAVENVTEYARRQLKEAAAVTHSRYEAAAKAAYPSAFGISTIYQFRPAAAEPAQKLA